MLVLSRKVGERLVINDNITITISKCGRHRVTIGVIAPRDVSIVRGEIVDSSTGSPTGQTQTCENGIGAKLA